MDATKSIKTMGNETTRFEKQRGKLKFDGTINISNIIAILIAAAALFAASYAQRERITVLEKAVIHAEHDRTKMQNSLEVLASTMNRMAVSQERLSTLIERRN